LHTLDKFQAKASTGDALRSRVENLDQNAINFIDYDEKA